MLFLVPGAATAIPAMAEMLSISGNQACACFLGSAAPWRRWMGWEIISLRIRFAFRANPAGIAHTRARGCSCTCLPLCRLWSCCWMFWQCQERHIQVLLMQNQLFLFLYRLRNGLPGEMLWLSRLSCMFSADRLGLQAYWGVALRQARGVIKKRTHLAYKHLPV